MIQPPLSLSSPQSEPVGWLTRWRLAIWVGALTLVSLVVLAASSISLGIPGEWTWARRSFDEIDPIAVLVSLLLCAVYWASVRWLEKSTPRPAFLCVLAFAWFLGLLFVQPDYQGLGRAPTVLFYKRTEGYFWQAAFDVQDSRRFLAGYRDTISTGDDPDRYLHLGTHPPGLTLLYRGLLTLFEGFPRLTDAVIALEPAAMQDAFAALRQFPTPKGQLTLAEEATLWTATLLTLFAVAGACWPIYRLTSRMSDPVTAWRAAALWPLVPSLLVFFPKSDLLCPVIATTSCWLWLDGWSRLRLGRCVLAGVGFFCGLMLTLALAPIALTAGLSNGVGTLDKEGGVPQPDSDRRCRLCRRCLGRVRTPTRGNVSLGFVQYRLDLGAEPRKSWNVLRPQHSQLSQLVSHQSV